MKEDYLIDKDVVTPDTRVLKQLIVESIQDLKGQNIVHMDLRDIEDSSVDHFVICEAESSTKIKAISDHIIENCSIELGIKPSHVEGKKGATWVLIDYFDIVVHIFYPEVRYFYNIEDLWIDAKRTNYENI